MLTAQLLGAPFIRCHTNDIPLELGSIHLYEEAWGWGGRESGNSRDGVLKMKTKKARGALEARMRPASVSTQPFPCFVTS